MRAAIAGLPSPRPLGQALPGLYHDDTFAQAFLTALDQVLAPVFCILDCIESYFDPSLAPPDFVAWLAGWLGFTLDENWPVRRQRALIAQSGELYRWRGTARGLAALVSLYAGVEPEIEDSGSVTCSLVPGAAVPGPTSPHMTVRVRIRKGTVVDEAALDALVAAAKPAHVSHRVEITTS